MAAEPQRPAVTPETAERLRNLKTFDPAGVDEGGGYVDLSEGKCYYELHGPEDGPLCVLIHGISWWSYVFEIQIEALVGVGARVLVMDLYGRGRTDTAAQPNTPELFAGQVRELVEALELDSEPFRLLGYSMGGGVATCFAATWPELVSHLVLIAPVGTPINMPWTASLLKVPYLGGLVWWLSGSAMLLDKLRTERCANDFYKVVPEELIDLCIERVEWQINDKPGFVDALFSTLVDYPMSDMEETYRRVGSNGPLVHVLWGEYDAIIPSKNLQIVLDWIPQAESAVCENAGHGLVFEDADWASREILYGFGLAENE